MKIKNTNFVRLSPESVGSGLTTKDGSRLKCFKIAGADKIFYPATAVIDGNTVVVSSTKVNAPVAVRHAFTEGAKTNFQNNDGIAAFPFRTDAWTSFIYFCLLLYLIGYNIIVVWRIISFRV